MTALISELHSQATFSIIYVSLILSISADRPLFQSNGHEAALDETHD